MVFSLSFSFGQSDPLTVTGKVVEKSGQPLPGVNILEKGTTKGALTDFDGNYTIRLNRGATLVFSYLGFKTVEIQVQDQNIINVTLEEDTAKLDEVVVIGYGTSTKKDLTGAVSRVDMESSPIANVPNVNLVESLRGSTSGVNIGAVTSAGGEPSILIRGQNTITAGNAPLIVLDGLIFSGSLNEINTNDVASFDILKDASSAAIYGSRAANGVIVITTKKGKSGKPVIGVNITSGIQSWTRRPNMRKGEDFIRWRRDNAAIRGKEDLTLESILFPLELKAYNEGKTIDWYDEVTQFAPIVNSQLSVSGKTDKTNYYVSANILDQKGVLVNDNYKQFSLTSKLDFTVTDWLEAGLNGYYSYSDYSGIAPGLYETTYMSPYGYKYVEGYENQLHRFPSTTSTLENPFWDTMPDDLDKRYSIRGIAYLQAKLMEGLTYRIEGTANRGVKNLGTFIHEESYINTLDPNQIEDATPFLNSANGFKRDEFNTGYVLNNLLTYKRSFGNHRVDALAGYTRDFTRLEYTETGATDFSEAGTSVLGWYGFHLADSGKKTSETGKTEYSNVAYLGRLNYVYDNKYHLTFNYRRDGYSGFSKGRKFGDFPGVAVAWTISEENFAKNIGYIKLRGSYGKNGNQAVDPYETFASIETGQTVFGNTTFNFSIPSSLANKELTWETTTALNLGVNFSFFNERISGDVNVYKSKTEDQLLIRNIPIMTGYQSVLTNIGRVDNKGIEVQLKSINIKSDSGFQWQTGLAFWMNRNKLVSLYGVDADADGVEDDDFGNGWFIGESLGAVYDFTPDGIVQADDVDDISTYGYSPGDLRFKDLNNDGVINADDRSIIGNTNPNYNLNVSNTISYKNFQLFFDVNFVAGGGTDNRYIAENSFGLNPARLVPEVANWLNKDYWMPDYPSTTAVRPNYGNPFNYGFWQSHEFVRLQNVSLSYNFDEKFLEAMGMQALKIYLSGKNLITSSDWIGLDPENAGHIAGSNPGIKTVSLGLNLKF
ncbi:TonB-dependent receptor [Snuella lapsa]|uniref:TonB-dependent receptor n=2 Tax=Snuella lapsa TaxID=870481 RepID=A0ABP6WPX2_9FLAO